MKTPETNSSEEHVLTPDQLYGIHVVLDGGEEKSLIDPNEFPPDDYFGEEHVLTPEQLYGIHVVLDGGEEESLIDPNDYPPEPEVSPEPGRIPHAEQDPADGNSR